MIPKGFTDPFRYVPHPLVTKAAGIVMQRISRIEECLREGFEEGKMMGVLIVKVPADFSSFTDWIDEEKRIGFLCAFSGSVSG
ncbi:MAG: RNA pseudouridine synthase, partial [Bacteroidales bacterium]|nr:RNA pseudouridine synthase [Bacteroidales bacterium]